jgi:hypothetical protein
MVRWVTGQVVSCGWVVAGAPQGPGGALSAFPSRLAYWRYPDDCVEFRQAEERGAATSWVDDRVFGVPEAMRAISAATRGWTQTCSSVVKETSSFMPSGRSVTRELRWTAANW